MRRTRKTEDFQKSKVAVLFDLAIKLTVALMPLLLLVGNHRGWF